MIFTVETHISGLMLRPRPFILQRLYRKFGISYTRQQLQWIYKELSQKPATERPSSTGLIYRLLKDEPLAYVLGTQPFGPLTLRVSAPVLIPRPETEEWTFELLHRISASDNFKQAWSMLDICTGSGCIPLLLLDEWPQDRLGPIRAYGVDTSDRAISLARANAVSNRVRRQSHSSTRPSNPNPISGITFEANKLDVTSSMFETWAKEHGPFDIVTANPPYVTTAEWHTLPASVKEYEDKGALVGGDDGLVFYTRIAHLVAKGNLLRPSGWLVVEIGASQGEIVKGLLERVIGLEGIETKTKTKAKRRYLKGKKERRKQRKAFVNANKPKTAHNEDSEWDSEEIIDGGDQSAALQQPVDGVKTRPPRVEDEDDDAGEAENKKKRKKEKKEKRPKKRRKEDIVEPEDRMDIDNVLEEERTVDEVHPPKEDERVVIPSFPLPSQPLPVSKVEVIRQGMDAAMLQAEIVDASVTESLDVENGNVRKRLSSRMLRRLADLGIKELFAVQTVLLPFLLPEDLEQSMLYQPSHPPRDVCASAPTGSGKTLAYAIPITEMLSTRIVTRLRALVVVPTRDLVQQVRETFEACGKGTKLQIGIATGQHSFAHEQAQIVGDISERSLGGRSRVDILICTPGRLIDHINGTPNFTLQHLRFLVIDEADRLLNQSFQEWLKQVLNAISLPSPNGPRLSEGDRSELFPVPDGIAPTWLSALVPTSPTDIDEAPRSSCQKLLFSATLTRDPAKIVELQLRDPKYFIVKGISASQEVGDAMDVNVTHVESFETPGTLREWMIVCESINKPLLLFYLAHKQQISDMLVFTKSAESTTRLLRLLGYFEDAMAEREVGSKKIIAEAFSSDLAPSQRKTVLEKFKAKQIDMLICSDLVSRGIDIPHVSHVVNYDIPVDVRKYIHRVGRTARAGREGDAWSLVEEQEMHHFKLMMKEAHHLHALKKKKVKSEDLSGLVDVYQVALGRMKVHYDRGPQA
ncbi:ATP-dependent RNA helicase dbp6 [Serendipita indica DSM 11827]|nr:ATP-dependent RNA helicase dbp6 [Serendipita indica DSM 11827]